MTRKHFRAFAAAIAKIKDNEDRREVAKMIADICADHNSDFKYGTFYKACNLTVP